MAGERYVSTGVEPPIVTVRQQEILEKFSFPHSIQHVQGILENERDLFITLLEMCSRDASADPERDAQTRAQQEENVRVNADVAEHLAEAVQELVALGSLRKVEHKV